MRALVAGWVGSTNLGDELVLAGTLELLRRQRIDPVVVSSAPARTSEVHGVPTVGHADVVGLIRAARATDGLVFGGGGIVQDVTSPLNLPYHLSRVWLARLVRRPVVGVGLGVGGLDTRLGHWLVRRSLRGARAISVRDQASAELLAQVGVPVALVAADNAFALDPPTRDPDPSSLVVCLRAWGGGPTRLPAAARGDATPQAHVDALAAALDETARRTDLAVQFVALQHDRDDAFHRRVAAAMQAPARFATPSLDGLLDAFRDARAVVSMRYHGGVAATLAGAPSVLVSYALKVDALARELGTGGHRLDWDPASIAGLPDALESVLGRDDEVLAVRDALRARQRVNEDALAALRGVG